MHQTVESFEKGLLANDENIAPSMIYAYAAMRKACRLPTARRT